MFKPTEVRPLPGYKLWLRYADGVEGEVDLSYLVGKGVFAAWNDEKNFERVRLGSGSAIVWSDEIDLCADALYLEIAGKQPEDVFPNLCMMEPSHA